MKPHRLTWSQRSSQDLRQIKAFIALDKPHAALQFIKKIKSKAERLKKFPLSGRIVPELFRREIREILVGNYRVIYKITDREILFLTVFEGHQQFKLQ